MITSSSLKRIDFKGLLLNILLLLTVLFLGVVLGGAVAFELKRVLIVLLAFVFGLLFLYFSIETLFYFLFILSFLVVGQLTYFLDINQAIWIPYLLSLIFFIKVFSLIKTDRLLMDSSSTPLMGVVFTFLGILILSAIVNQTSPLQVIIGSRNYIFMLGVFFVVAHLAVSLEWVDRLWNKLIFVVVFQIPIVLYQAFIIVPRRIVEGGVSSTPWDSVVGGFGGEPFGGGASPALAVFSAISVVYFSSLYKRSLITKSKYLVLLLLISPSLVLAEIKVITVLLPTGLGLLYIDRLKKDPFKFFVFSFLTIIILIALLVGYEYQKTNNNQKSLDLEYILDKTFTNQFDSSLINLERGEIGRIASLAHWWRENGFLSPVQTLIGHGPGSTKKTPMFIGSVAKKYYYINISRTLAGDLLWQYGFVGLMLFLYLIFKASYLSFRALKSSQFDSKKEANIETTYISLVLFAIMLFHSTAVISVAPIALMMLFLIGYSVMLSKLVNNK